LTTITMSTGSNQSGLAEAVAGRVAHLRAAMAAEGLDGYLVSKPTNARYLTGFTGEDSYVLITPTTVQLLTDSRFTIQAQREVLGTEVIQNDPRTRGNIANQIKSLPIRRLGFEANHLVYGRVADLREDLPAVELVDTREWIETQRAPKDAAELAILRRAVAISDQAFDEVSREIRPGMTEREVARRIEARMMDLGAEGPAFPTIVAAGPNGAMAHATPSDRPIRPGEPLVIDMGARYQGYNSDMTRTIVLGEADTRFREIYNHVLRAHLAAEAGARAGLSGKVIDALARDSIAAAGYKEEFGHGTGHGIGLDVHEPPSVSWRATDDPISENIVISIEPGIYLGDWGGVRIEDLVLLGPNGAEVLTQAAKHGLYEE
jgi:Xaa-Pro aminopeptidase